MKKELLGYDPAQVDAFLSRCLATPGVYRSRYPQLRERIPSGERVTTQDIRDARFGVKLIGYRIREVDALLDELHEAVELTTWEAPMVPYPEPERTISLLDYERTRSR